MFVTARLKGCVTYSVDCFDLYNLGNYPVDQSAFVEVIFRVPDCQKIAISSHSKIGCMIHTKTPALDNNTPVDMRTFNIDIGNLINTSEQRLDDLLTAGSRAFDFSELL